MEVAVNFGIQAASGHHASYEPYAAKGLRFWLSVASGIHDPAKSTDSE